MHWFGYRCIVRHMAEMEASVTIARPLNEVFACFLAVDEIAAKTDPGVSSISKTPDGPPGPGTTFHFRQETLGKVRETTTTYTAVDTDRRIDFNAVIGPMRPRCSLSFETTDGGTRVTFRGEANPVGAFKALSRLFNRKGQKVWQERLSRAREALEADA